MGHPKDKRSHRQWKPHTLPMNMAISQQLENYIIPWLIRNKDQIIDQIEPYEIRHAIWKVEHIRDLLYTIAIQNHPTPNPPKQRIHWLRNTLYKHIFLYEFPAWIYNNLPKLKHPKNTEQLRKLIQILNQYHIQLITKRNQQT